MESVVGRMECVNSRIIPKDNLRLGVVSRELQSNLVYVVSRLSTALIEKLGGDTYTKV